MRLRMMMMLRMREMMMMIRMRKMMLSEGVSRGPKKAAKTFQQLEILRSMFDLRLASASAYQFSLS